MKRNTKSQKTNNKNQVNTDVSCLTLTNKIRTCPPWRNLHAGAEPVRRGASEAGNMKFKGKNINNSKMCYYTSCRLNNSQVSLSGRLPAVGREGEKG